MLAPIGRRSARRLTHGFGQATQRARMLPTFLIAGAQRSGTSSLYRALSQHPNVLPAVLHKGVHYFDLHYDRGLPWYRSHFPLRGPSTGYGAAPARVGHDLRVEPVLPFHPLAGGAARQRPARHQGDQPDQRPGGTGVLGARPRARAELRDRAVRAGPRPRGRADGRASGSACSPTRRTTASGTSTSPMSPASRDVDQLEGLASQSGGTSCWSSTATDSSRTQPPPMKEVFDFLELPQPSGVTYEQHNARPRTPMAPEVSERLEEDLKPSDERLASGWDGPPMDGVTGARQAPTGPADADRSRGGRRPAEPRAGRGLRPLPARSSRPCSASSSPSS